jgi:hypothetical protein
MIQSRDNGQKAGGGNKMPAAIPRFDSWLLPGRIWCPRFDTQLNYMIDIALTSEFVLTPDGRL